LNRALRATLFITLIASLCLGLLAQPKGKQDLFIISGTVMALAEDQNGYPVQVEIQPNDGESYIVVNDATGSQLLRFVGSYVVASGTITLDKDGWKNLTVKKYQVTDDDGTITPGADDAPPAPAPPTP
jgi:hypothetical protein